MFYMTEIMRETLRDADQIRYWMLAAQERWDELLEDASEQDEDELSELIDENLEWFEQNCGEDAYLAHAIMVHILFVHFGPGGDSEDLALLRKALNALDLSACPEEIKDISNRLAREFQIY